MGGNLSKDGRTSPAAFMLMAKFKKTGLHVGAASFSLPSVLIG
jgi:hypothetical protein